MCGRRKGEEGFYRQTAVSSAAVPSTEDTQRGFPQKAINEVLLWGLLRIVSKEKWNIFLMVNHKRMLLHPAPSWCINRRRNGMTG